MNAVAKARHALRSTRVSEEPEVKAGSKEWEMLRKVLLICGILSSLLYIAMDVFVAMRWEGYSSASQTVSELSAIGAPTRPLWVVLGISYTLLVTAFGWGVWKSAGRTRALRIVGGLIVAYGGLGVAWPFAPMHLREALAAGGSTLSDTMHIVLGSVTVLLMLLAIGFGAAAFGKRFRVYSIASIVVLVAFGALTFLDAPRVAANLPTPLLGVWERINIGVFLLWVVVLAITLFPVQGTIATEMSWPRRDETFGARDVRQRAHEEPAEAIYLARLGVLLGTGRGTLRAGPGASRGLVRGPRGADMLQGAGPGRVVGPARRNGVAG